MAVTITGWLVIILAWAFYYHPFATGISLILIAGFLIASALIKNGRKPQQPFMVRCDYCGETVISDSTGICPVCGAPTQKPRGRRDNDDERTFSV